MACNPQALSAYGTILQVADESGNFMNIAELRTVSGPNMSAEVTDVTVHNCDSPFRQFISTLIDPGELSFEINWIPTETTHDASSGLVAMMVNRDRRNFRILWPDDAATAWTFPGVVTNFAPTASPADPLMASVTVKVTGPPTFA